MIEIIGGEINKFYDCYFYGVIYLLRNKINGKIYIGKTKQNIFQYIEGKFRYESTGLKSLIGRAVLKYGMDAFECKVIDCFRTLKELNEAERKYIQVFNSRDLLIGYNIAYGGEGGVGGPNFKDHKHSKESKLKMSQSSKHYSANKGKTLPEEWKRNIGIGSKGKSKKPFTEEHRKNISKVRIGVSPGNKGKKLIIENGRRKYV